VSEQVTQNIIAYQGEAGANSHIACQQVYPDWQSLPCPTFEDAFAALSDGRAQLAMIPVENSLNGRVADIHHFLPQAGLHIIGEFFLPIHFHLLALPGVKIEQLKSVYSHIHALGQCRNLIRRYKLIPVITGDTAGSAREVAEWKDPTRASLAPALAGQIYGLNSLAANVEDSEHNTTRFIILAREPQWPQVDAGACVTTFVFRVRNVPAALYKALGGFATNGVNLTKLESYMVEGEFAATQFLVDVDGHPEQVSMRHALEELAFFSREVNILGVYPAHPFRAQSAAAK
jgi:prephenate dehydratase